MERRQAELFIKLTDHSQTLLRELVEYILHEKNPKKDVIKLSTNFEFGFETAGMFLLTAPSKARNQHSLSLLQFRYARPI